MSEKDKFTGARQQFQEQIDFFLRKANLPSETWRDIQKAAHDRAFVVAGVLKADLLNDLRKAVDQAVKGASIDEFRKQFDDIVAKRGWTGWTGEGSAAGQAWRTRVIYQTNITTSYAAGRRAQAAGPALPCARTCAGRCERAAESECAGRAGIIPPQDHAARQCVGGAGGRR